MDKIKRLAALLLSAMLFVCMPGPVTNAAGANPELTDLTVTARLEMDPNVEHYPDLEFLFDFVQIKSVEADSLAGTNLDDAENLALISKETGPELGPVSISFGAERDDTEHTEISADTGRKVITLTGEVKRRDGSALTGEMFPTTGLYLYQVTEREMERGVDWTPEVEDDWLLQSKSEYILVIPVVYDEEAREKKIGLDGGIIVKTQDSSGSALPEVEKVGSPAFVNIYQRVPGTPVPGDSDGLRISKTVTGGMGDREKPFTFIINIAKNTTEKDAVTEYHAAIYERSDTEGGEDTLIAEKISLLFGEDQTFQLQHNQYLQFQDLPVGSRYTIREEDNDDYVTTATVIENGQTRLADAQETEFEAGTYVVGENKNRVDVTNARDKIVLTGIVTEKLSGILLIGATVFAMAAYGSLKRRLGNR